MKNSDELSKILNGIMKKRWLITLIVLSTFIAIIVGIALAVIFNSDVNDTWEKILLLMLGAFIGNYGKVFDYWFNDVNKDKMFVEKIDEEEDEEEKLNYKTKKTTTTRTKKTEDKISSAL